MLISTGSDPEFFITDADGNVVSSHTAKVKGDKFRPYALDCGFMHRDNVLLELNPPPSTCESEWIANHETCLQQATSEISDNNKYKVASIASYIMDDKELWHPEAFISGCDADYNAWNGGTRNPAPELEASALRSAGGHIHIAYEKPSKAMNLSVVQACDLFLAIPSLFMDPDHTRRELYGKAGCHRRKPYGVEYRVLSNFWTANRTLLSWAYRNTVRAVAFAEHNILDAGLDIERIINEVDLDAAEQLVLMYNLEVL